MSNRRVRALSGVALGLLIAFALWAALTSGHRARSAGELGAAAAETSLALQRAVARIDAVGAELRDALAGGAQFAAQADSLDDAYGYAGALTRIGAVELRVRDGAWSLRGARLAPGRMREGADTGAAAEQLRVDAVALTQLLEAPSAATRAPSLIPAAGDAPRFWAIWPDASAGVALAALFEIDATADGLGLTHLPAPQIGRMVRDSALPTPAEGGAERIATRIAVALGSDTLTLPISTAPFNRLAFSRDVIGPMSVFAPLILGALLLLFRGQRLRDAEIRKRQRAIVESIAAKQTALDESEARFRHLAESTGVIPWRADLDANRFTYIGPQIEELTGYPASTWRAEGFWIQHIMPQDRADTRADAVEKIKAGGPFTLQYRIRDSKGGVLHINNMMSVERIRRADGSTTLEAQGFLLDVTEKIRRDEELERAYAAAERANSVKSAFLATMSHELRTPLNVVIGFSEIMKDELFGPIDPQYRDYAGSVHASGKHLLNLINDILDLSKIEAGRFELHEEPTEIDMLLEDCRTLMQERIANAGLEAHLDLDPDIPPVLMDERRIKQVVLNLLSNAVKFTQEGGHITLIGRRAPGRGVSIAVRDTGIGMSPEEIPRALEKFGQIDGELSRRHDGTGLGLPIANSLVQLHDGALSIVSEQGVGTEIIITLPEDRILPPDAELYEASL